MSSLIGRTIEFGKALERLALFVPTSKEELGEWYEKAESLKKDHLSGPDGLTSYIPFFVWHYLSDADIRMKSRDYAAVQEERVKGLIERLKQGVIPSEDDA